MYILIVHCPLRIEILHGQKSHPTKVKPIEIEMSETNDELLSRLEAEKMVGLSLAICSGVLIGISFIITKKGLMDSNKANGICY